MTDPAPDVVGAIAETRADQAWAAICHQISSGAIWPEQLELLADIADSPDPAAAIRDLDDNSLGFVSLLIYAALLYASARLMDGYSETSP